MTFELWSLRRDLERKPVGELVGMLREGGKPGQLVRSAGSVEALIGLQDMNPQHRASIAGSITEGIAAHGAWFLGSGILIYERR